MVVVIAPNVPEPPMPAGVPVRIARDAEEGMGPLSGVRAGMSASSASLALVAGGDMPELQARVLLEMLREAERAGADAVALGEEGGYRPLPCVLRVAPAIRAARAIPQIRRRALRDLLDTLGVAVIDEWSWRTLDPEGRTLFDVDRPSDLGD